MASGLRTTQSKFVLPFHAPGATAFHVQSGDRRAELFVPSLECEYFFCLTVEGRQAMHGAYVPSGFVI